MKPTDEQLDMLLFWLVRYASQKAQSPGQVLLSRRGGKTMDALFDLELPADYELSPEPTKSLLGGQVYSLTLEWSEGLLGGIPLTLILRATRREWRRIAEHILAAINSDTNTIRVIEGGKSDV